MSSGLQADPDRIPSQRFAAVADDARVTRTSAALEANGFSVLRAANAAEAKRIVLGLLPAGSQVHHAASQTLEVSRIVEEIERPGQYQALRPRIDSAMPRRSGATASGSKPAPWSRTNAVTASGSTST